MGDQVKQHSDSIPELDPDDVRDKYQEVCESHRAITDFRGKLLTLLPIASGGAVYLLTPDPTLLNNFDVSLVAAGVFGFFITLGLFLHELRGIRHCGELIELGACLESIMSTPFGHFSNERKYYHEQNGRKGFLNNLIGPVGAAAIIYPSVGIAWLYLVAAGCQVNMVYFTWASIIVAIFAFVLMLLLVPQHNVNLNDPCDRP